MSLNLVDVFWTIQGEGANAGRAALFVRLPFCNLKCSWCDTEFNKFTVWDEKDFVERAREYPASLAVITGGEPSMNKQVHRVIEMLRNLGFEIAMETNGSFAIPDGVDWVTVSPKKDNPLGAYHIHLDAWKKANEFKYIIDDEFHWGMLERHNPLRGDTRYYLSPEFGDMSQNVEKILKHISKNPGWRMSLQTHKWIGVK